MVQQKFFYFDTSGRGIFNLTDKVAAFVTESKMKLGLCHVFLHHTSASLILCENWDPEVRVDLENFMARFIPDGDALFRHISEGPDDMPAHVRSVLTGSELSIPITNQKLVLGKWQGIFLWEHRLAANQRKITVTLIGEVADG